MSQLFTNNAISLLENPISSSSLDIHVISGDGQLFPQPVNPGDFFVITLEDSTNQIREIVKVEGRTGDVLHIAADGRGFEGTVIRSWPVDSFVDHRITAYTLNKIDQVRGAITDPTDPNIVLPSDALISDTYTTAFPNNLSCKWTVTVLDESTGRISIAELLAVYKGASTPPSFTVYAKTGDKLKYTIEVVAVGSDLKLNVINTDTVNFRINAIRFNY